LEPQARRTTWYISLQAWVALLALGVAFWLIFRHTALIATVGAVLFGALLLDLAIRPVADRLAAQGVPRAATVLAIYLVLGAILVGLASSLRPLVVAEAADWQSEGPVLVARGLAVLGRLPLIGGWLPSGNDLGRQLASGLGVLGTPALSMVAGVGRLLLDVAVALVLAFFFAIDTELRGRFLSTWVPPARRERVGVFLDDLTEQLTRWVWAQIGIALYFAVTYSLTLSLLRVPFALTIGIVGGVLEIIPYVGGAIGLLLAVLSAVTVYPLLAVWVILLHVVIVFVESHFVAPTLYGRVIGLHPAIVLTALLAGAKAGGILGVLFAVPVAVVVAAFLNEAQVVLVRSREARHEPAAAEQEELGE
jgi:predicted PurR-regulated permease PerM